MLQLLQLAAYAPRFDETGYDDLKFMQHCVLDRDRFDEMKKHTGLTEADAQKLKAYVESYDFFQLVFGRWYKEMAKLHCTMKGNYSAPAAYS